jgi:hypothetical protein
MVIVLWCVWENGNEVDLSDVSHGINQMGEEQVQTIKEELVQSPCVHNKYSTPGS